MRARILLFVIFACLLAGATGCMTSRAIAVSAAMTVKPGEVVEVTTFGGRTQTFTVTRVDTAALWGDSVRVPLRRIAKLSVRRVDPWKTLGKTGEVMGTAVLFTGSVAVTALTAGAVPPVAIGFP